MTPWYATEEFTPQEREVLGRHFTSLDGPVFALVNLPEVVKGALFARYSRTPKSLRRLYLDEFAEDVGETGELTRAGTERAERLYENVFGEYGDDSVAQLGGVHLACEQSSQLLCKALEWGRLAAYLEQSTRYMRYDDRPGGRWRATIPPEIAGTDIEPRFREYLDGVFETYAKLFDPLFAWFSERFPKEPGDGDSVYRSTITAKTCDTLRVLLPACTRSNLGIYATGQSYEQMLMRLAAHPLAEMREYGQLMLVELRKVIPAFLKRVDAPDRGLAWTRYWRDTREGVEEVAGKALLGIGSEQRPEVTLVESDPEGELKVTAAVLYAASGLPDDQLLDHVRSLTPEQRGEILSASVGARENRRHKPGRAWERTQYRFDVLCDYGAFRDLQRHRPLTIEWQRLTTQHGYDVPVQIEEAGMREAWERVMDAGRAMEQELCAAGLEEVAQYAVPMAFRIRFVMQMAAREAMHLTELGAAFGFISYEGVDLERLEAERRAEARRRPSRGA
ncbi:MAG: FAD-dependent thymidylate synthase [Actinobacteria bacterium]|nr:FAD-dependent thymidylate synthase [Actinomycetota bacterium]